MKKIGLFVLCVAMVGFAGADTVFSGGDMANAANWDNGVPNGAGDTNGIVNVDGTIPNGAQNVSTFSGSTISVGSNAVISAGGDLPCGNTTWIFNHCTVNLGDDLFDNGSTITMNAGSAVTTVDDFEVQGSAVGGGFIINGGSHTAGDYFGNQGGNRNSYIQFLGGTVTAARFRFKANTSGTSYTEISGSATAVATGTTAISDVGGDVDIQTPWTGSLKAANFSGSDWETVLTGSWKLDGVSVDSVAFSANFVVTDGGTTLMHKDSPASLPQFIADPVVKANATNGTDYVSASQTLDGSATNVVGSTMSYEKVNGPDWLVVAANGALSGTPTVTGTDVFTIKAFTGNYSSLGTLQITVDPLGNAPEFTTNPVVKADGVFGEDYALQSQSLTNSATDLDGDTLSYFKDGGPAWLNIASNGALSGVCNVLGTNTFTVGVDDGNGNSDTATLLIYVSAVGNPPVFTTDPIEKADGVLGADYALQSQSLTNSATDLDGDSLTYAKAGGPSWLDIAADGALSGVCDVVGTNSFPISVDDGNGNTDTATLLIFVPEPPLGDLIAGWDTFSGTGAAAPVGASVLATDITASFVSTTEGVAWNTTDERGASIDGSWGTHIGPPPASTNAVDGENLTLSNGTTGGTLTFSITNNSPADIELGAFHFDAYAFRPNAARTYELSVLAGGSLTEGIIFTSDNDAITSVGGAWSNLAHDDIDISLTGLADYVLGSGESVQFLLAFSSGTGAGGGHHLFVDNFGISTVPVIGPVEPPVMGSEISGGNMTISWTSEGSFKLQTRTSLVFGDWADVPGATSSPATVPATNDVEFLRLIEQ